MGSTAVPGLVAKPTVDMHRLTASDATLHGALYRRTVPARTVDHYAIPGAMTTLPDHPALAELPVDLDGVLAVVQGLLLHRDWARAYGVEGDALRLGEQQLRSTAEVLQRAFEISDEAATVARAPIDRVVGICRHFTLLQTALLRAQGVPARVRCGFSRCFDRTRWLDHWITERWDGGRWVRDDPSVDGLQAGVLRLDFDPHDQPAGWFLTGSEAWTTARAGELDAELCGIFDMWGLGYIRGNVLTDFACLNKVELLPWDRWGTLMGPGLVLDDEVVAAIDEVAALANRDDLDAISARYAADDDLRVPDTITTLVDGVETRVRLPA
jgi:hypothetical protein